MKRKIAAILAADAAEYSRLVAEDEEEALLRLVASIRVFKASVEAHSGRIFNTAGDAVLAEFQSAVEAVRSAIDIQHTLSARNQDCAPNRRMMFRMGISIGDVVENDGDLLGDGVNIAARLQTLSQPGGLAISKWVHEQVAGKVTMEFRDTGYQTVKNMPAPIHVFQSGPAAAARPAEPAKFVKNMPAPIHILQSSPAAAAPAEPKVRRAVLSPAAMDRIRGIVSLAVGVAFLAGVIVIFALNRPAPAPVALRETPPASAKLENPAPLPAAVERFPDQPASTSPQTPAFMSPEQSLETKEERASVETPAAPSFTLPPPDELLPASGNVPAATTPQEPLEAALPPAPAATAPREPIEAALPPAPAATAPEEPVEAALPPAPIASAPESSPAATLEREPSPAASAPASPVPAQDAAADRKRQKVQCAQVLERAQLGDLTSDDQAFLRSKCR